MRKVYLYAKAVLRHWLAWMLTSGPLAAIGLLLDILPQIQIPVWGWVLVLAAGLLVAQYKAYWDVSNDRDRLERKIDRKTAINNLAALLRDANDFRVAASTHFGVHRSITGEMIQKCNDYKREMIDGVAKIAPHRAALLDVLGQWDTHTWPDYIRDEVNICCLQRRIELLQKFLEDHPID